ncbi:RNA polymerase-binding protein DksA [Malaciobacter marinus]|uniref:DksA family protein n=1 Tax=Malaciobacter marinus TaxID=505249 RepID=A0A347TIC4_9BACT|nr:MULTISPECIES: RNA polymerase-binding protein DksA [Malaciobacter]AXX86352.1 DksA family protein [Malaciobacter marinus]PHO11551.1 molecular chaperone DnaK suppressor DksA [Malaciobacter marinus]PHO14919.1 molecular chaperone DnaK suppressor DksA [Malaciobacter marinus]PPK58171.1 TraR/DksA family transcriptional regulator [Malaciobacter marinus]RYA22461.1 RNA polymerase-binding protein DksA [Malaciobacter halophilus]
MANTKQIQELKDTLVIRREQIIKSIDGSRESINSLKDTECNDDYDYAEVSSDSFKEGIIANQQVKELNEIEDALKRIEKGKYGICEMCDELIAIGRLRAKPFAKFCTPCREIYEVEQQ